MLATIGWAGRTGREERLRWLHVSPMPNAASRRCSTAIARRSRRPVWAVSRGSTGSRTGSGARSRHEAGCYEEWGASGSLRVAPDAEGVMSGREVRGMRGEFQKIVATLMRTLLEEHPTLLGRKEIESLLDAEYCKDVLGLSLSNHALLRHRNQGRMVQGRSRYWAHVYAGEFHVCSQWWKDHHQANARALKRFVSALARRRPGDGEGRHAAPVLTGDQARRLLDDMGVAVCAASLGLRAAVDYAAAAGVSAQEYEPRGKAAAETAAVYEAIRQAVGLSTGRIAHSSTSRRADSPTSRQANLSTGRKDRFSTGGEDDVRTSREGGLSTRREERTSTGRRADLPTRPQDDFSTGRQADASPRTATNGNAGQAR